MKTVLKISTWIIPTWGTEHSVFIMSVFIQGYDHLIRHLIECIKIKDVTDRKMGQ